ncbi:hypothetical protein LWI28_007211 [Acer negundo]|uniref:Uncharacterized protein n=1 Tax=Acer negundo TaxID=4023 RepID=A0AAD5JHY8_ACENE|nr:hypothetical protein LWI28_007211 [Acer negundo]
MPRDLLFTRGPSLLAEAFKFNLAKEQQLKTLQEANIAAGAELEEARRDLARSKEVVDTLTRFDVESEYGR